MKTVKLTTHQKNYCNDDIIICQKLFPNLKVGDVVEIYSPEDDFSRLLLQVCNLNEKQNNVSIEQSIALSFQLRNFSDVVVNVVDPNSVLLDSVELFFKDQYLARSDMWRLKKHLNNSVVYLNKKIEFSNIRCQVFEMWSQGLRMASGYINEKTKVVFRSASSMVYIFLQMSSEMWDYDINGDLYFEKAVNGFLTDLFNKWKTFNCSHDVTIVLFSRSFYESKDINEFPESMHKCLQQDSKKRFYEDFYWVAVQNERFEDWTHILIYLRRLFNLYEKEVIHCHKSKGLNVPRAYNSSASQGNFLEVLNMSLNVFERHNLDRSFDRTGQLSVVISPGVGVYEVDLDLTNITKQRIIDNGIGSDLVCLGEQPLHAVPLFKFNSKQSKVYNDEYNMPHWINLSFYSSKRRFSYNFIPRIKMPNLTQTKSISSSKRASLNLPSFFNQSADFDNSIDLKSYQQIHFIDYDEYDKQIFCMSNKKAIQQSSNKKSLDSFSSKNSSPKTIAKRRFSEVSQVVLDHSDSNFTPPSSPTNTDSVDGVIESSKVSDKSYSCSFNTSSDVKNLKDYKLRLNFESKDDIIVDNHKSEIHLTKALINPFDPSHVTIKLNSNRRRWTHVFPVGPTGMFMQQHHFQVTSNDRSVSETINEDECDSVSNEKNTKYSYDVVDCMQRSDSNEKDISIKKSNKIRSTLEDTYRRTFQSNYEDNHEKQGNRVLTDNSSLWAWGATGEQEWTPAITTGVDWKSLVMPACLPITTDFLPDKRTLQQDYVTYCYDLLPDEQASEFYLKRIFKNEIGSEKFIMDQFYDELICQRLQQGFQIILLPKNEKKYAFSDRTGNKYTFVLSIGRIYHELAHKENKISITCYHPCHPYKTNIIRYGYRIRTPDNEIYGVSWADFTSEKLELYKWNYLDNFICQRGDNTEYQLLENLKYWRFRLLVLPTMQSFTKKIIDKYTSGEDDFQSNIYNPLTFEEKIQLQNGFLKLIEVISKIKRPLKQNNIINQCKFKPIRRHNSSLVDSQDSTISSSSFQSRHSQPSEKIANAISESITLSKLCESDLSNESLDLKNLSIESPHNQIIDLMKSSLNFLKYNLPEYTFISSEAIDWAVRNVDLIDTEMNAELLFQSFINSDLIRHASGDPAHPFKRGFYLYCIMNSKNSQIFENRNQSDFKSFERFWMEVGVVQQHDSQKYYENWYENSNELISSQEKIDIPEFTFKNIVFNLENKNRTKYERCEWINLKYHSLYDPEQAFEMIIEWMVATGNAIPEMVSVWGRTKNTGLHIVPIPWDPFSLPFSNKSDPLRGPIYLSMNTDCFPSHLLDSEQLFNFQEKILCKFGFIPFHEPLTENQRQFVHVSGSIFIMIPSKNPSSTPFKNLNKRGRFLKAIDQENTCSPHEEYITRHFSGAQENKPVTHIDIKNGFLWCWNYMVTKRWKTSVTGDETSMRKIMKDFRAFCANNGNRLKDFWLENQRNFLNESDIDTVSQVNDDSGVE